MMTMTVVLIFLVFGFIMALGATAFWALYGINKTLNEIREIKHKTWMLKHGIQEQEHPHL